MKNKVFELSPFSFDGGGTLAILITIALFFLIISIGTRRKREVVIGGCFFSFALIVVIFGSYRNYSLYNDYKDNKFEVSVVEGKIKDFLYVANEEVLVFDDYEFKHLVIGGTRCLKGKLQGLEGVKKGTSLIITYQVPERKEFVDCILKIEILDALPD